MHVAKILPINRYIYIYIYIYIYVSAEIVNYQRTINIIIVRARIIAS